MIPADEMVQKIKAAVDARESPETVILARTDARAIEGLDRALDRVRRYQDAGADVLFVEAPMSVEELQRIPKEVPGLHSCNMVIGGSTPILSRERLRELGFARISYANAALQASALAIRDVFNHLRDCGSIIGFEHRVLSFDERQSLLNKEHYDFIERQYSTE